MKQLLIVKGATDYAAGDKVTASDLSGLEYGAIAFCGLEKNAEERTLLYAKAEDNFAIALGRKTNPVFLIPEVDYKTLSVVKAEYDGGETFKAELTVPTVEAGTAYTLVLVKKGTVPHERNRWTATHTAMPYDTSESVAKKLADYFANMAAFDAIEIKAEAQSAKITIEGIKVGAGFELKGADGLFNVEITTTDAKQVVGDKSYVQRLASECAAGKGFNNTAAEGREYIPGYPEEVEDEKYNIYTLRFRVGRDSAKTRDERVWQLVHIAIPQSGNAVGMIETVLDVDGASNAGGSGTQNP